MAKQIYIDENGNEVLVSGTITNAGNLPLGSDFSDPNSTAGAINSLITTDTVSGTVNIGANNYADPVYTVTKTGYTAKGLVGLYVSNTSAVVNAYYLQDAGTKIKIVLRNVTGSALSSVDITAVILYVKDLTA